MKYFGKYYTTLNQKLWWMSFTASQHMHVSGPIQIYKSNKARRSVLWKVYAFFYQQNKDRKQKLLSISWQFANVTLAYVTDFWVSRGHKTLWWLEILTKQIQNRSQRFWMHFNSAFPPEENYFTIVVTEFHQAMTVSVRSCDLNDFAGSNVAEQTFFSRHIKSYLRLLPTQLKARNNIFTVKT